MPTLEEGFSEVKTINWIFEGSDEDRRRFNMYINVL
jgi:bifunctional polynucleotide phosphatase/kinase